MNPARIGVAYACQVNGLDQMLPEYYQLRGWDEKGVPTTETLQRLAL